MSGINDYIDSEVKSQDVVLFMKGSKSMPQCGFSSRVAGVLNYLGIDYADVDVLADADVRHDGQPHPPGGG